MTNRFKMPPYDPADESSVQYALDQIELFLNSQTSDVEGRVDTLEGANSPTTVALTSDASAVVGTAYGDAASGLNIPLTNGVAVRFYYTILWQPNAATTGARFAVSLGGATFTALGYTSRWNDTATTVVHSTNFGRTADSGFTVGTASNNDSNNLCILEGAVVPSADGTLKLRSAAEVASPGSVTVKAGSTLMYW